MSMNCWEFKKCGREPNGLKAKELGVCPAAIFTLTNKINSGKNGGRSCWAIAGTLCGGKVQGEFASKMMNCMQCEFYKIVWKEENDKNCYIETAKILKMLADSK